MKHTILAFLMSLFGCAHEMPHQYYVNPDLELYVDELRAYMDQHKVWYNQQDLVVDFASLTPPTVGTCTIGPDLIPYIRIDNTAFSRYNETARRMLLWHEMGHCMLLRDHTSAELSDGMPASLMYPEMFDPTYFLAHQEYYLEELINNR